MNQRLASGVVLPDGHTGSSLFHAVLSDAVSAFPRVLGDVGLPLRASAFKRSYGPVLARFEAARVASAERAEIARYIVRRTQEALEFASAGRRVLLSEYLATPAAAPQLNRRTLDGPVGLPVEVPYEGRVLRGPELAGFVDQLFEAHQLTAAARRALHWIIDYTAAQGGRIDLREERFVILGAAAELAPTRLLLRAGASVLWIDLADPVRAIPATRELSGTLVHTDHADNLLERPREIAAAIAAFAADGPVHVGMYAYAAGASQEWRLGAAMQAIVASLDPALVRSVSLLVSPTTPSILQPETVQAAVERGRRAPAWQRLLARLRAFQKPGHYHAGGVDIARATVAVQGLSYQAAQYIAKIVAAESYAAYGVSFAEGADAPLTVSANVAGITRTRSLSHPLFEAAFAGAHHFGVRIFDPATTRALNGLLTLHDLLNPSAPSARSEAPSTPRERAARLHSQQIHGGIYGLPWVLDGVIAVAALVGLGQEPTQIIRKLTSAARAGATRTGAVGAE